MLETVVQHQRVGRPACNRGVRHPHALLTDGNRYIRECEAQLRRLIADFGRVWVLQGVNQRARVVATAPVAVCQHRHAHARFLQ